MVEQPTGEVAFLFSDIEGSTRRWIADAAGMQKAVADHDRLMREVLSRHGGYVFSTAGDSFAVAFPTAAQALEAASDAQRALAGHAWSVEGGLAVRIGLHVGRAEQRGGDYFGPELSRAARIMDAAHGGQVLVSTTAASLAGERPTIDLGEYRLRDLPTLERLHQLVIDGLPDSFPPPRSLEHIYTSLPVQHSSFVGRHAELTRLRTMVTEHRLITLTGTGGTGKTRLAIEVGARERETFPGGVFFVDLSAVTDATRVATALADGVGARIDPAGPVLTQALGYLEGRRALVIVDNCEHLLDETAELVLALLNACPNVSIIATTREPLDVPGEQVLRIPSLSARDAQTGLPPAVRLFIERATAANPDLRVDDAMRDQIAEVCEQLDGIPLAIELAAARCRLMTPADLLVHLGDRFMLLAAGSRRARQRQATMEAAIDWSYGLLEPTEQRAFRLLCAFAGPFDLDDAAALLDESVATTLPLLDSLTAKSLITADLSEGRARHRLLETLRAYGQLRLADQDEVASARDRHLAYCLGRLASLEDLRSHTLSHVRWMESHRDDLALAVAWADARGREEDLGHLTSGMWGLLVSKHDPAGNQWLDRALAGDLTHRTRNRVLFTRACTAMIESDLQTWTACTTDAAARPPGDLPIDALLHFHHHFANVIADPEQALDRMQLAIEAVEAADDRVGRAFGYMYRGLVRLVVYDLPGALSDSESVDQIAPPTDPLLIVETHTRMTRVAALVLLDRAEEAAAFAGLARIPDEAPSIWGTVYDVLYAVAISATGRHDEALALIADEARSIDATAFPAAADTLLAGFGLIAQRQGEHVRAKRLLGSCFGMRSPQLAALVLDANASLAGSTRDELAAQQRDALRRGDLFGDRAQVAQLQPLLLDEELAAIDD